MKSALKVTPWDQGGQGLTPWGSSLPIDRARVMEKTEAPVDTQATGSTIRWWHSGDQKYCSS